MAQSYSKNLGEPSCVGRCKYAAALLNIHILNAVKAGPSCGACTGGSVTTHGIHITGLMKLLVVL